MRVIIIGAGAAGLFAGAICAQNGDDVTIVEKNDRAGIKLSITGKGRCNVTNSCDWQTVIKNIPENPSFMYSALSAFSPYDTYDFFESNGVKLKTERGNRVFPQSDKATDIVDALVRLNSANKILFNTRVTSLIIDSDRVAGVRTDKGELFADKVIVATGGKSYPRTGSTGDGYTFAIQAGHSVTQIRPSLIPLQTKEHWCRDVMGLSLKNVKLTLLQHDKEIFEEQGEMLFTHFGISGPIVLSGSAHITDLTCCTALIDMKPALTREQLDKRLLRDFEKYANKDFQNSLVDLLPKSLIPVIVKLSEIHPDEKVNQITKEQRLKLVNLIKNIPLTVSGFRPINEAIITRGGIETSQINPKTMESKICKNLYFAGEVINVDAYTGGFNLQIAFSTAYAAANN